MHAEHAGAEERRRVLDAAVHVRLGREIHDRVGVRDEGHDLVGVGDVAHQEPATARLGGVGLARPEVGGIAGVGQLVEDRDEDLGIGPQQVAHEGAADEPGAAGDQQRAERAAARVPGLRRPGRGVDPGVGAVSADPCLSSVGSGWRTSG